MKGIADKREEQKNIRLAKPVMVGTGVVMATLLLLSVLLSVLFSSAGISASVFTPAAVFMLVLASFIGSIFAARLSKAKGLPVGIAVGITVSVILFILNLIFLHNGFGWFLLAKLALILVSGAIGGIIGVNFSNKRK